MMAMNGSVMKTSERRKTMMSVNVNVNFNVNVNVKA